MVTIVKKSNVRLLTKALAVVSILAPASGHPLGIGEIKLHSALNQNLNAEIALTLSGESVTDIKVNLAPPEKFDEAGVSWSYFLSKIKFETIAQPNGSVVIKLTSKEALKEPFLDFLLEVSWPKGNLYREFTVLVDPPSVYNQATIPVSTSAESYAQPPAVGSQTHANGQTTEGQYGPTLENDTLWSVADRVRGQSDVSVEQMMIALYEANPEAFYKGNVYALTSGKILKIPERAAVLKLSRNQALAEFNRHKNAWRSHSAVGSAHAEAAKEKTAPSAAERAAQSKAEAPLDNQLTLIAPTKAAVTDKAVVTSERASADKKTAGAATDGASQNKVAELEKQLAMMQELIALKDQQLAALQNQSQASPAVQEQLAPSEVAAAKLAEQATSAPQQAVTEPAKAVQSAEPVQATEPVQIAQPDQAVEPVKPAEPVQATQAGQPAEPVKPVEPVQSAQPVQPVQSVKPSQPVQPAVQPEPDSLIDPYYLGVGGAGAAILTLLGWLWWRKRKVEEETNTESMFASTIMLEEAAAENISVPVVEDSAAAHEHDAGTVGESSFLSEFTPSDFDSFDTDQGEIDPISEADVYLAYGRYQQAEELIRQAIIDQPNRDECKLKLLEVFYANENQAAFEAYANELAEAGKRNEAEFWEKAAEMGREICPDSPLFSSGSDLFAVADSSPDEDSDEGVVVAADVSFKKENMDAGAASFEESANEGFDEKTAEPEDAGVTSFEAQGESFVDEQRNNEGIDFDLGSFSMEEEAEQGVIASSAQTGASSDAQIESVDFDLSSFSMDTKTSEEAEQGVIASGVQTDSSSSAQVESIDFDLGSFSTGSDAEEQDLSASSAAGTKSSETQISDLDFDLGSFSTGSDVGDQDLIASSASEAKSSEAQIGDLDFDLGSFSTGSDAGDQDLIASSASEAKSSEVQLDDLDFDLGSFSTGSDAGDQDLIASSASEAKSSEAQLDDLDFDLSSFSMDGNESDKAESDFIVDSALSGLPTETPVANKELEFDSLEFDFSELDNDDKKHQDTDSFADSSLNFNDDLSSDFDFDFDLDMPSTASGQDSSQNDAFGVSDLTDMDELETKLDLAKAYIDMGDAEAAKEIAKEVLEQGSVEQKKIAQTLLDELN